MENIMKVFEFISPGLLWWCFGVGILITIWLLLLAVEWVIIKILDVLGRLGALKVIWEYAKNRSFFKEWKEDRVKENNKNKEEVKNENV